MSEERLAKEHLLAAQWSRRRFLTASGAAVGLAPAGSLADPFTARASVPASDDPFSLGVASGDPLPDAVVIWTRLAPRPLEPFGGMDRKKFPVTWIVAEDEGFRRPVARGTALAYPEHAHAVHVDVIGLRPAREYFYRFAAGPHLSPVGRTKTAPAPLSHVSAFAFAFASCQNYPSGFYTAYRHMAEEDLDVVVHLGDYIYEGGGQGSLGRGHLPAREICSLDDYRIRTAQHKTDPDLQRVHARHPWIVTWDDHEVDNNYADEVPGGNDQTSDEFLVRRANAYRAYWEHMPLRRTLMPTGPDMPLYRRLTFGDLVEFNVLDTRQYRSDQDLSRRSDPSRSITGDEQERWLLDGLGASRATWNVLAQQVFFCQRDLQAGSGERWNLDAWDGYVASRDRITSGIVERGVANPIVLTGDVHQNYAADIKSNFDDPDSATIGSEFVGTSISSGGDGSPTSPAGLAQLEENPHLKYYNRQRGYVHCRLTPGQWRADYRIVPYVTRKGAPIHTEASFVVDAGRPGLQPA